MLRLFILAVALVSLPAAAKDQPRKLTKQEREAMALTPADASLATTVRGMDELDPSVWVSTEPFLKGGAFDRFFRAIIDKETGSTIYQLYFRSASSRGPIRLSKMTYLVHGRLKSASIERIDVDVSCRNGCMYFEDAVASLPRDDLEALALDRGDGNPFWRMRLFNDAVDGADAQLLRNETAGFLIAVDRERERLGFVNADVGAGNKAD